MLLNSPESDWPVRSPSPAFWHRRDARRHGSGMATDNRVKSAGLPALLESVFFRSTGVLCSSSIAPTVYNSLPVNVRLCHSVDSFKHHLKTRLLSLYAAKHLCIQGHYRRYINVVFLGRGRRGHMLPKILGDFPLSCRCANLKVKT